jgi:hypothetical protein
VQTTLPETINSDLAKYVAPSFTNVGIDLSLVQPPVITNDDQLSIFFKGTVFNSKPIFKEAKILSTVHPNFEIGAISRQDLMLHITEETA